MYRVVKSMGQVSIGVVKSMDQVCIEVFKSMGQVCSEVLIQWARLYLSFSVNEPGLYWSV